MRADKLIRAVDSGLVPAGQYDGVLIDEVHDFAPQWLKLVAQMVNPETNSLLVMYDDAEAIYGRQQAARHPGARPHYHPGRRGPQPLVIKLPTLREEAEYIANHLKAAHRNGTPWSDMAVIYREFSGRQHGLEHAIPDGHPGHAE
ncbi:MAG: hypothetical protein WAZ34_09825 [Rhodocyclaceae bacterium]